jgi:hypothetical protein
MSLPKKEEKRKSMLDKIAEKFGFQRNRTKQPIYDEINLGDFSVRAISDRRLADRIEMVQMLITELRKPINSNATPKQKCKILRSRLDSLNEILQCAAAPYGRGGDAPRFAKLLHGANQLFMLASAWCITTESQFCDNDFVPTSDDLETSGRYVSDNEIVVHNLELSLAQHIFPDMFDALDYCFQSADVSEKAVLVLQSMVPPNPNGQSQNIGRESEAM